MVGAQFGVNDIWRNSGKKNYERVKWQQFTEHIRKFEWEKTAKERIKSMRGLNASLGLFII